MTVAGKAVPEIDRAPSSPRYPRRRGGAPPGAGGTAWGWIVKIVLLGLADAVAVTGLLIAIDAKAWGYATLLAVTLVVVNVVYLPRQVHPAQVPRAGRVLPRRVRALSGAVHGVLVDHQLRHRSRAQPAAGDRPDPEPVDRPRRRRHRLRRHAAGRQRRSVRRLCACTTPRPRTLFLGTDRSRRPADRSGRAPGAHDHAADVRRQRRRLHRRPAGQRRHAGRATPPTRRRT